MNRTLALVLMLSCLCGFAGRALAADFILTYTRSYHEKPDDSIYAGTGIGVTGDMNFEVKGEIPLTVTWNSDSGEYRGHISGEGKETVTMRSGSTVTTWPEPQERTCTRKWDAPGQSYPMVVKGKTTSDGPNMAHFAIMFRDEIDTSYPFTETCAPPDTDAPGPQKDDTYEGLGDYGFDMRLEDGATLKVDDSDKPADHLAKKDKDVIVFTITRVPKAPIAPKKP